MRFTCPTSAKKPIRYQDILLQIKEWVCSDAMKELVSIFDESDDDGNKDRYLHSENLFIKLSALKAFANTAWDYRKGLERNEINEVIFGNKEREEKIRTLLEELGFIKTYVPEKADLICILGGRHGANINRTKTASVIQNKTRCSNIVGLTCFRGLDSEELQDVGDSITTEYDSLRKALCESFCCEKGKVSFEHTKGGVEEFVGGRDNVKVYNFVAPFEINPSTKQLVRPNTLDTFQFFLEKRPDKLKLEKKSKIVFVTTTRYVNYQFFALLNTAISNGYDIECVGDTDEDATQIPLAKLLQEVNGTINAIWDFIECNIEKKMTFSELEGVLLHRSNAKEEKNTKDGKCAKGEKHTNVCNYLLSEEMSNYLPIAESSFSSFINANHTHSGNGIVPIANLINENREKSWNELYVKILAGLKESVKRLKSNDLSNYKITDINNRIKAYKDLIFSTFERYEFFLGLPREEYEGKFDHLKKCLFLENEFNINNRNIEATANQLAYIIMVMLIGEKNTYDTFFNSKLLYLDSTPYILNRIKKLIDANSIEMDANLIPTIVEDKKHLNAKNVFFLFAPTMHGKTTLLLRFASNKLESKYEESIPILLMGEKVDSISHYLMSEYKLQTISDIKYVGAKFDRPQCLKKYIIIDALDSIASKCAEEDFANDIKELVSLSSENIKVVFSSKYPIESYKCFDKLDVNCYNINEIALEKAINYIENTYSKHLNRNIDKEEKILIRRMIEKMQLRIPGRLVIRGGGIEKKEDLERYVSPISSFDEIGDYISKLAEKNINIFKSTYFFDLADLFILPSFSMYEYRYGDKNGLWESFMDDNSKMNTLISRSLNTTSEKKKFLTAGLVSLGIFQNSQWKHKIFRDYYFAKGIIDGLKNEEIININSFIKDDFNYLKEYEFIEAFQMVIDALANEYHMLSESSRKIFCSILVHAIYLYSEVNDRDKAARLLCCYFKDIYENNSCYLSTGEIKSDAMLFNTLGFITLRIGNHLNESKEKKELLYLGNDLVEYANSIYIPNEHNDLLSAKILGNLGQQMQSVREYGKALNYHRKGLMIKKNLGMKDDKLSEELANSYNSLATDYYYLADVNQPSHIDRSIRRHKRAISERLKLGDDFAGKDNYLIESYVRLLGAFEKKDKLKGISDEEKDEIKGYITACKNKTEALEKNLLEKERFEERVEYFKRIIKNI